mmetsp:Transcript_14680/g.45403  ORF Transcript_14680/g.45403 Transcript_14680/m.45403 type:complete len:355 (-) Transcript_14680:21-1085(-)
MSVRAGSVRAVVIVIFSAAAAAQPPGTKVFYGGLNGSSCYRIPTIVSTRSSALVAFAESRGDSCDDQGTHSLVARRSLDGGDSWGPLIEVAKGEPPCPGCPAAISNPNPVEVSFPDGSTKLLLAYDTMNNPSASQHGVDMQIWSADDGLTWENATEVAYGIENVGALVGPSAGLQSASGSIYFSAYQNQHSDKVEHFLYWSDDYGSTWKSSPVVYDLGECSMDFETSAAVGTILMNCRNSQMRRAQLTWSSDGVPSNVSYPDGLIDPGCQGSIVNLNETLYLSNLNSTTDRTHITVKSSFDRGTSWTGGTLVWAGPAAYSQLVALSGGLGLLYEGGVDDCYEAIWFTRVATGRR